MKFSSPSQVFSPYRARAQVETNRIPYSTSGFDLSKGSPGRFGGGVSGFASPKYQSWGDLKKEIRTNVSTKVSAYESTKSFIKKMDFNVEAAKPVSKKQDHRLLIQGLFTTTPQDRKKLDFDAMIKDKKYSPLGRAPSSPSKVNQQNSFLQSVGNKFPGRNNSLDLEHRLQTMSFTSNYAPVEPMRPISRPSSALGDDSLRKVKMQRNLPERVTLGEIVRISNQLADIRVAEIPNLSTGYVQELLGLQSNIQRIVKNHKQKFP